MYSTVVNIVQKYNILHVFHTQQLFTETHTDHIPVNRLCLYLFCRNHGDNVDPLLPDHLPEVGAGVGQWSLGGDVVPLLPPDHHLTKKTHIQSHTQTPQ